MIKIQHFNQCISVNNYYSNGIFYNGSVHCWDRPVELVGYRIDYDYGVAVLCFVLILFIIWLMYEFR